MSSILQALRELEASKAPAKPGTGAWTEEQNRSRTWLETVGIIAGGLAIGAAAFAFIIWLSGLALRDTAPAPGSASPGSAAPGSASPGSASPGSAAPATEAAPPAAPPPPASEPAAGSPAPPGWLSRAEPPRARVAPGASPSERVPAASRASREPAQSSGAVSPVVQDDSVLAVSSISYSPDAARRSVTMRVGGTVATLREGQATHGVEVQLILPGAVYVRRGPEIVVLEPER